MKNGMKALKLPIIALTALVIVAATNSIDVSPDPAASINTWSDHYLVYPVGFTASTEHTLLEVQEKGKAIIRVSVESGVQMTLPRRSWLSL
jgi:hypothetical protein